MRSDETPCTLVTASKMAMRLVARKESSPYNSMTSSQISNNYIIYNRIAQETKREVCLAVVAVDPSDDEHLDLGDEERYTNTDSNSILLILVKFLKI
ncbi:hypothetical protein V1477_014237 [Vespula maculifrons]|uniref:Uncharacterized protein n=1 Tax=Vespula maculifrons TaxID=7453 RepID=A0ABD2BKG6_VESMC